MGQELAKALREIIEEKDISILQLAKEVSVDRTTLQKFFDGKRKLKIEVLYNIMTFLNLTKEKRKILYVLYEKGNDDKDLTRNAQDIFSLYQGISDHVYLNKKNIERDEYSVKNGIHSGRTQIVKGQVKIETLIRNCFSEEMAREEKAHIIMSINFKHLFLYESIIRIATGQKKCGKIQNMIPLVNKKKMGNNLDILQTVLLLNCLENVEYEPYYFYTGTKIYDDISIIVPNYFITSKQVITIDRDFQSAIIYEDPEIIAYYREKAQSILRRCERLVDKKMVEIPKNFIAVFEKVGEDGDSTKFYSYHKMNELLKESFNQNMKSREKESSSPPDKSSEKSNCYILRENVVTSFSRVSIRYSEADGAVEFSLFDTEREKTMVLCVTELGIVTVFKEFFHFLPKSVYVYSKDELDRDLKSMRNILNQSYEENCK